MRCFFFKHAVTIYHSYLNFLCHDLFLSTQKRSRIQFRVLETDFHFILITKTLPFQGNLKFLKLIVPVQRVELPENNSTLPYLQKNAA